MIPSSTILPTRYGPTEPAATRCAEQRAEQQQRQLLPQQPAEESDPLRVCGLEKSRLGRRQRTAARPLRVGVVCARASGPAMSGTSGGKSCMTSSG